MNRIAEEIEDDNQKHIKLESQSSKKNSSEAVQQLIMDEDNTCMRSSKNL